MSDYAIANAMANRLIAHLQSEESAADPMDTTAAVAITLGAMVATLDQQGITKEGQSGSLLVHLFKIAESVVLSEGSGS